MSERVFKVFEGFIVPTISEHESMIAHGYESVLTTSEYKRFKWSWLLQVVFNSSHHLWVSRLLNLHGHNEKVPFIGPCHLRKKARQKGKKAKLTTKVILYEPKNI